MYVSSPAPPFRVSLPFPPTIKLFSEFPLIISLLSVPLIYVLRHRDKNLSSLPQKAFRFSFKFPWYIGLYTLASLTISIKFTISSYFPSLYNCISLEFKALN